MQSVGEVMAIGRTFPESLQKALRSPRAGPPRAERATRPRRRSTRSTTRSWSRGRRSPTPERLFQLEAALRRGHHRRARWPRRTGVDPWFLDQIAAISDGAGAWLEPRRRGGRRSARSTGRLAAAQAARVLRRPARLPARASARPTVRAAARRRRGRGRPSRPSTPAGPSSTADTPVPLLDLRGRGRGPPGRPAAGRHPRLGTQPDRPGDRVRLLLRARQHGPARRPATRR